MAKLAHQRYIIIPLLLIITFLAALHLDDSIWTDEQRTLYYVGAAPQYGETTLPESVGRIAHNLWQAPTYYLLLWGWGRIAGWSVFALRLLSIFAGLLTVAGTYHLVGHFYGKPIACYAAFILGLNAFFINFMHDMRAYILYVALTVLMFWTYTLVINPKSNRLLAYSLFTLSLIALLYTHYFAVFPIAALGLCHLIFQRRQPAFWQVIACFIIAGLAFLPWLHILISGTDRASRAVRSVNNFSAVGLVTNVLHLFSNGSEALLLLLLCAALQTRHVVSKFLGLWLIFCFGLLWGMTRIVPALTEIKYVFFFWPVLATVVAIGIQRLRHFQISPVWILLIWAVMFGGSLISPTEQKRIHPFYTPPLKELSTALAPYLQPQDAVLFVLPPLEAFVEQDMLDYYFYGMDMLRTAVIRDTFATTDKFFRQQVEDAIRDAGRIWITYETNLRNWRLGAVEESVLPAAGFMPCELVVNNQSIYAALFAARPTDDDELFSFAADDSGGVDVYLLAPPQLDEDKHLSLLLGWYLPEALAANPYSVGIHVEDTQGQFLSQADFGITYPGFDCQFQTIDMSQLAAGDYIIKVTVYNWQTGERLASLLPADDGQRPVIGQVTLTR